MRTRKRGFTRVELVIVIVVLVAMTMVLLMSNGGDRTVHRLALCSNNMRQISLAHHQFHAVNNRFCGYVNSVGYDYKPVSWAVPLFPYLDRGDLWQCWSTENYQYDPQGVVVTDVHRHAYVETLVCPNNPPADTKNSPLSYAVNGGYGNDVPPSCADNNCTTFTGGENIANGIFHDHYGPFVPGDKLTFKGFRPEIARVVTMQYVASKDGASRTILLSENVQWATTWRTLDERRAPLAILWFDTIDAQTAGRRINVEKKNPVAGNENYARPSSFHAQGVNVAFADAHVKFVSESIPYDVYKQLMTCDGATATANPEATRAPTLDETLY